MAAAAPEVLRTSRGKPLLVTEDGTQLMVQHKLVNGGIEQRLQGTRSLRRRRLQRRDGVAAHDGVPAEVEKRRKLIEVERLASTQLQIPTKNLIEQAYQGLSAATTKKGDVIFQLRSLFEPFGTVEQVILYKPQFAYVVFKWVSDASDAKYSLDLQKQTGVGEYIDVLLRDVQFARHAGDTRMQMSSRPYDKLRIDFRDPALPLPSSKTSSGQPNMPVEDDFFNDDAFSSPEVLAILHR